MPIDGRLKTALATLWDGVGLSARRGNALTILYYHAVPDQDRDSFDRHMRWLSENANIVGADHRGPLARGRPNVAVTFDDAFDSVRRNGWASIERYAIPVTIFVPSSWMGRTPGWGMEGSSDQDEVIMTPEQLRALPASLVTYGSHTRSHPRLSTLSTGDRLDELVTSRTELEHALDRPITTLAFPYGDHDAEVIATAGANGYDLVFSILPEAVDPAGSDICRGRTAVDASDSLSVFRLKARGGFTWLPRAIGLKRRLRAMVRRRP